MKLKKIMGVLLTLLFVVSVFGCGKTESQEETVVPESPKTVAVTVYYPAESENGLSLIQEVHEVPQSDSMPAAALQELISGTPITEGAYVVLPEDTKVLSLQIEDGLATIDFSEEVLHAGAGSEEEELGLASIVNTLTEFPTITKVQITVEGSVENGIDWWGHIGLYEQPFLRDLSLVQSEE